MHMMCYRPWGYVVKPVRSDVPKCAVMHSQCEDMCDRQELDIFCVRMSSLLLAARHVYCCCWGLYSVKFSLLRGMLRMLFPLKSLCMDIRPWFCIGHYVFWMHISSCRSCGGRWEILDNPGTFTSHHGHCHNLIGGYSQVETPRIV